ncbi:hypothetical protein [Streptomyces tubercidicus]
MLHAVEEISALARWRPPSFSALLLRPSLRRLFSLDALLEVEAGLCGAVA